MNFKKVFIVLILILLVLQLSTILAEEVSSKHGETNDDSKSDTSSSLIIAQNATLTLSKAVCNTLLECLVEVNKKFAASAKTAAVPIQ